MKKHLRIVFPILIFLISWVGKVDAQSTDKDFQYPNYWSVNREYKYTGLYLDSSGNKITTEIITFHPTGKVWDADTSQTLMDVHLDSLTADWSKIPKVSLNGIFTSWSSNYQEGVLQDTVKIWIHPIRQNQYILTELAPFPEVRFPFKEGVSWKTTLWIYAAFGTFEGTVESTYTVNQEETRDYRFGKLKCWKIVSTGVHDKLGINTAIYYFNTDYGFTEMNYTFYNQQKIEFRLIALKF